MALDDETRLAAARAELVPLRSEVESYRVQALTWRERARELERRLATGEAVPPSPSPLAGLARLAKRLGRRRSSESLADFDPAYYRRRYRDLDGIPDAELLRHWERFGRPEGRRARSSLDTIVLPDAAPGPDGASTLLVVTPDATDRPSSSLAADLVAEFASRHRVVVLVLTGGTDDSRVVEAAHAAVILGDDVVLDEFEAAELAHRLVTTYAPRAAVLSTSRSRDFAAPLETLNVPCVVLIQEFAEDVSPRGELANLVGTASSIVFPGAATRDSALREHAFLRGRDLPVIHHGRVRPPTGSGSPPGRFAGPDDFVIVGAGPLDPAHGVDLFLQVIAELPAEGRPVRAVWIGGELEHEVVFADLVRAQARSRGLPVRFHRVDDTNPTPYLERADAVVLSARLEAISTLAVEAGLAGIPVVAFDGGSAFAEVLAADPRTAGLVVPYLDVPAAARVLEFLRGGAGTAAQLGDAARAVAEVVYDTARYARDIESLVEASTAALVGADEDRAEIVAAGVFDPDFYWGARGTRPGDDEVLDHYLRTSRLSRPRARARAGLVGRKGARGFHPLVFAEHHPDRDTRDPLAEWVRLGRPDGPWTHRVIRPGDAGAGREGERLRVVVHGHFFYPEALPDLLDRLDRTVVRSRLVLTTDTEAKGMQLRRTLDSAQLDGEVLVVPNVGRDVGPLLTGVGFERLEGFDVLLHVHGKKSTHAGGGVGDQWRDFLFGTLVAAPDGPPAGDAIVAAFSADPALGLVFPEDANLNDWDENRGIAEQLAPRLGIPLPLPVHFDFPMGGMYWARVDAIRPLFELRLDWDDYPDEPVPVDGTLLHTLERLSPFVAASRGYGYATVAAGLSR